MLKNKRKYNDNVEMKNEDLRNDKEINEELFYLINQIEQEKKEEKEKKTLIVEENPIKEASLNHNQSMTENNSINPQINKNSEENI